MRAEAIVDEIREKIAQGSEALERLPTRARVDDIVRRNRYMDGTLLRKMSASDLMVELTKASIRIWPNRPAWSFRDIETEVKPLKAIAATLDPDKLNEFVRVHEAACVMDDSRLPVEDFKKDLWKRLFTQRAAPEEE